MKLYETRDDAYKAWERKRPVKGYVDECKKKAARELEKERESFERCDTDGFLSQWCHQLTSRKESWKHDIMIHGGTYVFPVLIDTRTGEIVSTREYIFVSQYSYGNYYKWRVKRNGGLEWVTDYKRESNFTARNLAKRWVILPAQIQSRSRWDRTPEPRGTGGLCNVSYYPFINYDKVPEALKEV